MSFTGHSTPTSIARWPSRSFPRTRVVDPDRKRRFLKEARAASALNHPNIITVHDIRSDGGIDFIVMEYVDGTNPRRARSLRAGIRAHRRRCSYARPDRRRVWPRAHEAGIVHRDLKPSNVMVTDERPGQSARLRPGEAARAKRTRSRGHGTSPLTGIGPWSAQPRTCLPNRPRAGQLDARSDIFSAALPGVVRSPLVLSRRQPRGVHVDGEAEQSRHLRSTDRRRVSAAADHERGTGLQPGMGAGRPGDRVPASAVPAPPRAAPRAAPRRQHRAQGGGPPARAGSCGR